jgi:predicted nucleic acid-binding protein
MTEAASIVYVDANPIAYALEGPEELASALKALFGIFRKRPGVAVTSELTLAEVLPKKTIPDRHFFDLLIWSKVFDLREVTREILIETARYRRMAGMPKLPDSIHVVTAIQAGCSSFLSSDSRIRLPETMKLIPANKAGIESLMRAMT